MDIEALLSSLTEEDIGRLKDIAGSFFGNGTVNGSDKPAGNAGDTFGSIDPDIIKKAAQLSSALNMKDERCDFLLSLKPLLSEPRRKKADDAIMMLKILKLISLT